MELNGKDINEIVNTLCARFGTTVEFLIPEMGRYMVAIKFAHLLFSLTLFIILILILRWSFRLSKQYFDKYNDIPACYVATDILGSISSIILGCMLYSDIVDFAGWMASPYGATVAMILEQMK